MKISLYLLIIIAFLSQSCREGCDDPSALNYDTGARKACKDCCVYQTPDKRADIQLEMIHLGNGAAFSYDSVYVDDFGNDYKFTRIQYYLSGHTLENDNGVQEIAEYMLVSPAATVYTAGKSEAGHFHELKFTVGIDSATNHSDPALYASGHPLSFQSPSTHWSWSTGYIFIMLEGLVDADNDGTFEGNFVFHIGTDSFKSNIDLTIHQDIMESAVAGITVNANYTQFFTGINLETDNNTHTADNLPLANALLANVPFVFSH
jgi:hypothetical protein